MTGDVVIDLFKVDQGIYISLPYSEENVELCRKVPGRRWDKEARVSVYPLSMATCRSAREVFGSRLRIMSQLNAWAKQQVLDEQRAREAGAARDGELKLVPTIAPRMAAAMAGRKYQRSGAAFIREQGSCLIADEVGLGKSLVALAGVIERGLWKGQHLIIAPKTAVDAVWGQEIRKWTDGAEVFTMPEGKARRAKRLQEFLDSTAETKFLVVNKEMLRVKMDEWCAKCESWKDGELTYHHYMEDHKMKLAVRNCEWPRLFEIVWSSVINDEAHKTLSTGLKSTQNKSQMAEGVCRLLTTPDGLRLAVTGTPIRGKEVNLWGPLFWTTAYWRGKQLKSDRIGGKWPWAETYLEIGDNGYGRTVGGIRDGQEENFAKMLDPIVLRRTRREVRSELPARVPQEVWVGMSDKHLKQYETMREEGIARLENGELETTGVLAEITRLKQLAWGSWELSKRDNGQLDMIATAKDSPKLRVLEEMLERRGLTGNDKEDFRAGSAYKFIVASQFTQIVDCVEAYFNAKGVRTLKITGAVTGAKRAEAVQEFQDDPNGARLMVLNTMAGGESITLDRYCDEMFVLDETFISDDQEQLEGRIDNRSVKGDGDERPRIYHYVRTEGTIEETIARNNINQRDMQAAILDKRRGVEVATRLLRGQL